MQLTGQSIIGAGRATASGGAFFAVNARTGERLEPAFHTAGAGDLDEAVGLAWAAFADYRALPRGRRAEFLREIAAQLEALGDALIERVMQETALAEARVRGERDRTASQLRFFAGIVEEGSWVDARIDTGDPGRKPAPKLDLRSMLRPLGPVAVFCASNFPLAFSVAGGDTASALAAGNPVVVNAHFSHPGTAEMCGSAIAAAARRTLMPDGVFSLLFSQDHRIGQALVAHPLIKAAGFTGSRKGGLALAEIARSRPEPIPFYAEMSSVNPVFVLPHALAQRGASIASGLHASVTLGAGQFCTNPGVAVVEQGSAGDALVAALGAKIEATAPAPMLNSGILENYCRLVEERTRETRLRRVAQAGGAGATAALFETDVQTFLDSPELAAEVFGPATLAVRYRTMDQALEIAASMEGNLTATIHMAAGDEEAAARLVAALETRVGRILFEGFPTGVEVCQAMVHGGAWPATTDGRSTSVGGRAIDRFARPVCFQDAPASLLPEELRAGNPAAIWRIVDGVRTRDQDLAQLPPISARPQLALLLGLRFP
ncbi:MAG: aldehyde dehydrogenase (NADP(+)) [Bryobacteraceae bacterium]|jgi:NADP-dependent aldehyde dehydrogenase